MVLIILLLTLACCDTKAKIMKADKNSLSVVTRVLFYFLIFFCTRSSLLLSFFERDLQKKHSRKILTANFVHCR